MPIQFRCPNCARRLSVGSRKAGCEVACPNCKNPATVPAPPVPVPPPIPEPVPVAAGGRADRRLWLAAGGVAAVLVLTGFVVALRKSPVEVAAAPAAEPTPQPSQPASPKKPSPTSARPAAVALRPNSVSVQVHRPSGQVEEAPPPRPVVYEPFAEESPGPPPPDEAPFPRAVREPLRFGKLPPRSGNRILVWSAHARMGDVLFGPKNPLWKALADDGFAVRREFGAFDPQWLKSADQFWLIASGRYDFTRSACSCSGVFTTWTLTPEDVLQEFEKNADWNYNSSKRDATIPAAWAKGDYLAVGREKLRVLTGRTHPLSAADSRAVEEFVRAGKGVYVLTTSDSHEELDTLYMASRVTRDAHSTGGHLVHLLDRQPDPDLTERFRGRYWVPDHPLLAGVDSFAEGSDVLGVVKWSDLDVLVRSSAGGPLVGVVSSRNRWIVLDTGSRRYWDGPTEKTSAVRQVPGTVRLARNVAAFLSGRDPLDLDAKKP